MTTFHKLLIARVEAYGSTSGLDNLAADLVRICANETGRWTNRADDAMRIPDMLHEAADVLRARAMKVKVAT